MNAAKTTTSGAKGGRAHAPVTKGGSSLRIEMAVVTEAPGQGDELAVLSRRDKETAMATANVVLDDNVARLGTGAGELGRTRRTAVERGTISGSYIN